MEWTDYDRYEAFFADQVTTNLQLASENASLHSEVDRLRGVITLHRNRHELSDNEGQHSDSALLRAALVDIRQDMRVLAGVLGIFNPSPECLHKQLTSIVAKATRVLTRTTTAR